MARWTNLIKLGAWGLSMLLPTLGLAQTRLYVSPEGADAWSGSLSSANADRSDGPKATIAGARDAIRAMKRSGSLSAQGAVVEVAAGRYPQLAGLQFTAYDSGAPGAPIVYESQTLRAAVIDGAAPISNWGPLDSRLASRVSPSVRSKLVCADLGALGIKDFGTFPRANFSGSSPTPGAWPIELFVDGKRQTVARWPNQGYAHVATSGGKLSFTADLSSAKVQNGDPDVLVCGFPSGFDWAYMTQAATIDRQTDTISFAVSNLYPNKTGGRFFLKNSLAELDAPGEYFVDRPTGLIVWYPTDSSLPAVVSANTGGALIQFVDAHDIALQGFTVQYARRDGVSIQRGADILLQGLTVDDCGGNAVVISDSGGAQGSAQNNTVQSCVLEDLGEGGVSVSSGDKVNLTAANNVVQNNVITRFGQIIPSFRPGVQLVGVGNRAVSNDVFECPHCAIRVLGNNNQVDSNHIWDACLDSSDSGAIHLFAQDDASQRGNSVTNNVIEKTYARIPYQGYSTIFGIYLDGRTSGVQATGNVVDGANTGIYLNGGRDNVVENNVLIDCPLAFQVDDGSTGSWPALASLDGAIASPAYAAQYPKLANLANDDPLWPKGDLFATNGVLGSTQQILIRTHNGVHIAVDYGSRDTIGWQNNAFAKSGLFVDDSGGNYVAKPGSALALAGFKPVNAASAGVKSDAFVSAP